MKRFSLLSGAYVNAGDFLIVHRTKELLKSIYKDCEIIEYERRKSIEPFIDEINKTDALIIAGGPAYTPNLYPEIIPLVNDLNKIKTKIIPIGLGWYGKNIDEKYIYEQYKLSLSTKKLIDRILKDSKILSCRDYYTQRALLANGYKKSIITGCPAWYDLDNISNTNVNIKKIKNICISDPANIENLQQAKKLIEFLIKKYKNPKITFVFHRNENKNDLVSKKYNDFQEKLSKYNINFKNISFSHTGFSIYDNCDLHIGFRVHAHIYNLSKRNISILIEEDGRGAGVNECLGLASIKAYDYSKSRFLENKIIKLYKKIKLKIFNKNIYLLNKYLISEIESWINILENDNYKTYEIVFQKMKLYYENMKNYIINTIE